MLICMKLILFLAHNSCTCLHNHSYVRLQIYFHSTCIFLIKQLLKTTMKEYTKNSKLPYFHFQISNDIFCYKALLIYFLKSTFATVYKGNIIKNLIMDCQSYTKYRPNETTGGIFVSWRRKEELPTGA